jgi:hypothetical protein
MLKYLKKAFGQHPAEAQLPQPGSESASQPAPQPEESREELIRKLDPAARERLALVEEKRERILQLTHEAGVGKAELASERDALDRILATYLKHLADRQDLEASRLEAQVDRLLESLR